MQQLVAGQDGTLPESVVASGVGVRRLAVGLLQGLLLYLLYSAKDAKTWPATEPYLFVPMLLVCVVTPVLWMSSLGHLTRTRSTVWVTVSAALIAGLGLHDAWRGEAVVFLQDTGAASIRYPSALLTSFLFAGFFIAHSLVLSSAQDQRRIASYPTHFESSWKLAIQLVFSALFVGVLWASLWLGNALFMLVKLDFLGKLLRQAWFFIPVTAFGFACAMHITDVRPAIVRGIRALLLVLLSWVLPVTALMCTCFLASLALTGLQPLWATRSATLVLLSAAATLVILINAAYQAGDAFASVARVVRASMRLAALALVPIVAIAVYALGLRVNEYGWTTDRVIAAACLLVASCYAVGYTWAVLRRSTSMQPLATTNVTAAYLVLVVLLALFSPLADPARLAVKDQVTRLQAGRIAADRFDFDYLKFQGLRYGQAALEQLGSQTRGADAEVIREGAQLALSKNRWNHHMAGIASSTHIAANVTVWPEREQLPVSFMEQNWSAYKIVWELPACMRLAKKSCDAFLVDVSGDGKKEVLLLSSDKGGASAIMVEGQDGWSVLDSLPIGLSGCDTIRQRMIAGDYQMIVPVARDLEVGGIRVRIGSQEEVRNGVTCPLDQN